MAVLDGFERRKAGLHEKGELLGIVAVGGNAGVGAECDPDAGSVHATSHVEHLWSGLARLGGLGRREECAGTFGLSRNEVAGQQGRDEIGAVLP